MEGHNFQFTYSFVFNYTILPLRAGTFKIPPQMVEAGGSALHTPPLTLLVADSGSAPAPRSSSRSSGNIDPTKIAFAELTLSKAPAEFGGAVGNFTLLADAKPGSAQVGDPFTVTATITGRGNFDRVTAPAFEDERGWHKYPPSSEFKQDDDVGISGTKTFETVLS